jgi:hypothetical protein
LYLDIIETRTDITEAWRGICASFYFLGKYDEAAATCLNANSHLESSFVSRFVKECVGKVNANNQKKRNNGQSISILSLTIKNTRQSQEKPEVFVN